MNTADTVMHRPTGETWTVAYVHGDELCPCGWPETIAKVSDCDLLREATQEERDDEGDERDRRRLRVSVWNAQAEGAR